MSTRQLVPGRPVAAVPPLFTPVRGGLLQRQCACGGTSGSTGECGECTKRLQRRIRDSGLASQNDSSVPPIVHEVLRSPGQPLDPATRAFMEPRFGHDFSGVRVHTDSRAAQSARTVDALAYTLGRDVVFGAGQYSPGTPSGWHLLAHELAHVIQQQELDYTRRQSLALGPAGDPWEQEADRMASVVTETDSTNRMDRKGSISSPPSWRTVKLQRLRGPLVIQRQVPTGITLKEIKSFGHADLAKEEDKKRFLTNIGAVTLMQLTPPGDYTSGQKKGACTKEFLTEVSNTCPAHEFCTGNKCLEVARYGTVGDPPTQTTVTDGPDTFVDRHVTRIGTSFLEGSKDKCSVVCHQRYQYRTEPDKTYHDLGSFYIIRNFRAAKYTPPGRTGALSITTGEIKKVPAALEAPSKEKFAKDMAPGQVKSGALLEAPRIP